MKGYQSPLHLSAGHRTTQCLRSASRTFLIIAWAVFPPVVVLGTHPEVDVTIWDWSATPSLPGPPIAPRASLPWGPDNPRRGPRRGADFVFVGRAVISPDGRWLATTDGTFIKVRGVPGRRESDGSA